MTGLIKSGTKNQEPGTKNQEPRQKTALQKDNFQKEYDFNPGGTRDFHIAHYYSTLPFHLKAITTSNLKTLLKKRGLGC